MIKLFILSSDKYFDKVVAILKKEAKNKKVIYVTTNKPYSHISGMFKKNGVKIENIFFIDCISEAKEKEADNCIYLGGPGNITGISIAVNKSVKAIPGEKILFLDSLSTLLMYNDEKVIGKFSNFILNKMRLYGISSVVLALNSDMNKNIMKNIESIVDEVNRHDR